MDRIAIPNIQLRQTVLLSLDTLRANKFRSFLTILGVVIGVTSVIAVASIIQGLNNVVQDRVAALGTKVFFVSRFPPFTFGRLPERIRKRKFLYLEDAIAIREQCPSVEDATPFQQRAVFTGQPNLIRYGNERVESAVLRSAEPQYISVLPIFSMRDGRFISDFDNEHSAKVCAIGSGIADTLFPATDPVSKEINLNGQMFSVIGVFERDPGLFGGPGIDQFVMIPYNTFHKLYPEIEDNILLVSVYDPVASLQGSRRSHRRLAPPSAGAGTRGERLRHGVARHSLSGLEAANGGDRHPDDGHFFHRPAGGRHRRHEYHAGLGDGADSRNRHP